MVDLPVPAFAPLIRAAECSVGVFVAILVAFGVGWGIRIILNLREYD